jgi:hypothetical protein
MAEHPDLELERLKLERLKVYGKIVTVAISVVLGTLGVTLINSSIQRRQLEQQRLENQAQLDLQTAKAVADQRQAEMKYLGDYLQFALEDKADRRLRFVEYFAALTISKELQEKWEAYHTRLKTSILEAEKTKAELLAAEKRGEDEKAAQLAIQLSVQQSQLAALVSPRLRTHIQTRNGKVTEAATRVRRTLASAGYLADYEKVFDMTKRTTNIVSTNAENVETADRILQLVQPLGLGEFVKDTDLQARAR